MCAGLVLQPITAFATEPVEEEIISEAATDSDYVEEFDTNIGGIVDLDDASETEDIKAIEPDSVFESDIVEPVEEPQIAPDASASPNATTTIHTGADNFWDVFKLNGRMDSLVFPYEENWDHHIEFIRWNKVWSPSDIPNYPSGYFGPGRYTYDVKLTLDLEKNPEPTTEPPSELRLFVDGRQFNLTRREQKHYDVYVYYFTSPEYTIEDKLPSMGNLYIVDNTTLRWNSFSGASKYVIYVSNPTFSGTARYTSFNLAGLCKDCRFTSGTYSVYAYAVDGSNFPITRLSTTQYTYTKDKAVIGSVTATCDFEEPEYGGEVKTFTFSLSDSKLQATNGKWLVDNDGSWGAYEGSSFDYGVYRYAVDVSVKNYYKDDYKLSDDNFNFIVNSESWDRIAYDTSTGVMTFASKEFKFEKIQRIVIGSIDATSDITEFMVDGAKLKAPEFKVTKALLEDPDSILDNPEFIELLDVNWEKKIDDEWTYVEDGETVTEGTYRYIVDVSMNDESYKTYFFGSELKLLVDNQEWTFVSDKEWYDEKLIEIRFQSPEYVIKVETPPEPEEGQWVEKYGSWYYVSPTGEKTTGMQEIEGTTYLFSKSGTLQSNVFYEKDGNKYYFGQDGTLVTGWFNKWSSTYYADENGVIQTGFTEIDGDTYYFKADGRMTKSTWITSGGNKYYSKADGKLAKSETITKWGKKYVFNEEGILTVR